MFTGMKRSAFLTLLPAMLLMAQARAQNPARIEMGHKLFQKNCSACHGSEAKGGRGPDLTTGQWKSGSSDADILRKLTNEGIEKGRKKGELLPKHRFFAAASESGLASTFSSFKICANSSRIAGVSA